MSIAFTFCTLVTDEKMYADFKASAIEAGFGADCEFLFVDNTKDPQEDAYSGLNRLISEARGDLVICCHQDILFEFDTRETLEERLQELRRKAKDWAVCGIAGMTANGQQVTRISDKFGNDQNRGDHPASVASLDECFLILRADTGLRFSNNIEGFHFYGTDICLMADVMGYRAYAIDFHLRHLGGGAMGASFAEARSHFLSKWQIALRDRMIWTTSDRVFVSGQVGLLSKLPFRPWLARKKAKWGRTPQD